MCIISSVGLATSVCWYRVTCMSQAALPSHRYSQLAASMVTEVKEQLSSAERNKLLFCSSSVWQNNYLAQATSVLLIYI